MGKLSELMAEATKNITKTTRPVNVDHVFTGITKETNLKVISTYVTSKDRFERIGIAANPALTVAQQEILSNDKLDSIKQALCYNFNLDTNIAVKLLDEDVDTNKKRLDICERWKRRVKIAFVLVLFIIIFNIVFIII